MSRIRNLTGDSITNPYRHAPKPSMASSMTLGGGGGNRRIGQPLAERLESDATPYESVFVKFDLENTPQLSIQHSCNPDAPEKLETFAYAKLPQAPPGGPSDGRFQGGPDELLCVRLNKQDFVVEHYIPPQKSARIKCLSFQRFEAQPPPPVREEPRLLNLAVRDETGLKSFVVLQSWPFGSLVDAYVRFYRKDPSEPRPTFRLENMKAWERISESTPIHELGLQSGDVLDVWITMGGDKKKDQQWQNELDNRARMAAGPGYIPE